MASQVPYAPDPRIGPNFAPTPELHVDAPPNAFGMATAQALSHLGDVTEHAGDELFNRANALQILDQQAQAARATSDYITNLGQIHADYTNKLGKDAIDGWQPYTDAVNQSREDIRAQLTSPIAQRAYDQESRNMMSRAIWAGSDHLSKQNKNYLSGTAQARMETSANYALSNPEDEASFQAGLKDNLAQVNTLAGINGWSDDQKQTALQKANSNLYSTRIQGLAKTQPFTAQKLLDDASKNGMLSAQDAVRLGSLVSSQRYTVGSRQTASNFMAGGDTSLGDHILPIDRALETVRANETTADGNYSLIHPAAPNGDHAIGAYGVMSKNLPGWLAEAGMPPMTQAEFLRSPEAQDKLVGFKISQFQQEGGSFNAALNKWFTGQYHPAAGANDGHTSAPEYVQKANAYLARTASASELNDAGHTLAQKLSPEDPMFEDYLQHQIQIQHGNQLRIQKEDEFNNSQTIAGALGPDKDGKLPTSIEEIIKDPKVEAAWNGLRPTDQVKYMKVLQGNIAQEYELTPATMKQYQQLVGIAKDPQRSPEDTDKFLKTDVVSLPLPWKDRQQLLTMQKSMFADRTADPQLSHAWSVLGEMMNDAGIKKEGSGKDDYLQFTAAFHDVYQTFLDDNKRKPNDSDIQEMGAKILAKVSQPGKFFGTNEVPLYQVDVPVDAKKSIITSYKQIHGIEPPDSVIHSVYVARQYQELYGPKKAKSQPPQVPISQ